MTVLLLLVAAVAVALAAWSVIMATSPAVGAQEVDNDFVFVPLLDQSFGSINLDDECLITNRRELEGPVEMGGLLRAQGIMVVTSVCPEDEGRDADDVNVVIKVFSVLCEKVAALDTHALCDVKLVAEEDDGGSGGGGGSGSGSGSGQ